MTLKDLIFGAIVVVIAIIATILVMRAFGPSIALAGSVPGDLLAEQYDPYVSQNGGYYSNKPIQTNGGLTLSTTGTTINRINAGQCYFAPSATTIAASTTKQVDCQATAAVGAKGESALVGVSLGDNVLVELSTTTTGNTYSGIQQTGCTASSTPGYISCNIFNGTGATFTWPTTGTASGTASYYASN